MTVAEMKNKIKEYMKKFNKDENYAFISYSHLDAEMVYPIVIGWLQKGYNIFIDIDFERQGSDDNWIKQMKERLRNNCCSLAICFVSENYYFSYASMIELLTMRSKEMKEARGSARNESIPIDILNLPNKPVAEGKKFSDDNVKNEYRDKYFNNLHKSIGDVFLQKNKLELEAIREGFATLYVGKEINVDSKIDNLKNNYTDGFRNFYPAVATIVGEWRSHNDLNGNDKEYTSNMEDRFGTDKIEIYRFSPDNVSAQDPEEVNNNPESVDKTAHTINDVNHSIDKQEQKQEQQSEPKPEPKSTISDGENLNEKKLISEPVTIALAMGVDTKIEVTPNARAKSLHDMFYALMENLGEYSYRYTNASNPEDKKKYKPDGDNWLYNMVNNEIPPAINSANFLSDEKYYCKAGCGNGNWATCPWIAVFNRHITCSTTEGVYIVYLLDREKKELYLTLNQGMTSITKMVEEKISKKGRDFIKEEGYSNKGEYIATILRDSAAKIRKEIGIGAFLDENISTNVWQYDVGCICSKKYTLSSLPSDEVLLNDLANMLKLYDAYFEKHRVEYQMMKDLPKKGKKLKSESVVQQDKVQRKSVYQE